ncbi:MAG: hypothetical protein AVDCRST_MAG39-1389 [uncultured Sphingomonadaceae bacterium]|uniref:Glycosyltransferase 2-like domain-containing protein n=1 Tax=uncultured Sphingomonadaceae bacterium TaxID=169976 RepID=A0A6J4SJ36_9SPHN|nr:MAG: hypothetical protein AVDCRST_MAG39-1389 [uncultured Sphingomonadaceae bacterium]
MGDKGSQFESSVTIAPPVGIGRYYPDAADPQSPANVAVAIPTVLRPVLAQAVESVFAQRLSGRVQLLVGVDKPAPDDGLLDALLARRPPHVSAVTFRLPFSTSVRNGGLHKATDGGALRAIMSLAANAPFVAYLDDDNSWKSDHLAKLLAAIPGKAWAFAQRVLVEEGTWRELGVDTWDSVGVDRGRFAARGGFVDPNCLMVDKVACARALGRWAETASGRAGMDADRWFFEAIRRAPHGRVDDATVRYTVRPTNILLRFLAEGRIF